MCISQENRTPGEYNHCFVDNFSFDPGVKIHYIEKKAKACNPNTVILSPGLWEPAERAIPLFEGLDSHSVSLSYRGRGQSGTPKTGYNLEHHVSDLKSVVDAVNPDSFFLLAFSRGVGYACGYLEKYPEKVKGFIIVDHPPIHVKPWSGYAEYWKNLVYLGNFLTDFIRPEVLDSLEREADEVVFWNMLSKLNIPILLLRGTCEKSKIASDLSGEDILKYKRYVKNLKIVEFKYSGHMIVDEELGKYRMIVNDFINNPMNNS